MLRLDRGGAAAYGYRTQMDATSAGGLARANRFISLPTNQPRRIMTSQHEPITITLDPQTAASHCEFQAALEELARAAAYALEADCSPWDFAVEIETLTNAGLTTSDLRWLVIKGYLEHAYEITGDGDAQRRFQPCRHLAFGKRTCFVLTDLGSRLTAPQALGVARICADGLPGKDAAPPSPVESRTGLAFVGQRASYSVSVGSQIVKQYRVPSLSQEAILDAFEEEGWPPAIDDPLPPQFDPGSEVSTCATPSGASTPARRTPSCVSEATEAAVASSGSSKSLSRRFPTSDGPPAGRHPRRLNAGFRSPLLLPTSQFRRRAFFSPLAQSPHLANFIR